MRHIKQRSLVLLSILLGLSSATSASASTGQHLILDAISTAELKAAGVHGMGCYWLTGRSRGVRFGMVDKLAVVKIAGRPVMLRADSRAGDMFPFTFDRWRGDGITIAVTKIGSGRQTGLETLRQSARLNIKWQGRSVQRMGTIECGS